MFQNELLSRIAKNAPVTVMARALFENVLNPKSLDSIFQRHVRTQRQRSILFSFLVELMLLVACQIRPRIHSAYKAWHEQLPFTVDAVYDKIAGIELSVSEALVRETSEKIVDILREVRPPQPTPGIEKTVQHDKHNTANNPTSRKNKCGHKKKTEKMT